MKKDLVQLCAISAVIAVALAILAARHVLPAVDAFNPLENWSLRKSIVALLTAVVATVLSGAAIFWSDRGLPRPSATLEWVYSSAEAKAIAKEYEPHRQQALRGVVLDSVAFIPSYVFAIALLGFLVARGWTGPWASWTVVLGWSVVFAGAFDYLENAGIYLTISDVTTRLAPLTYAVCQLKWLIAIVALDFAIIAGAARFIAFIVARR